MLLYYITDRTQFVGGENERRQALVTKVVEAARCDVDLIQLREKDLSARELQDLARTVVEAIRHNSSKTRLLVNSRTDVAIACGADGVHLRSEDVSPEDVRLAWKSNHNQGQPYIGVSCHTRKDVSRANSEKADFVVFAPVFEKRDALATGVAGLWDACEENIPVIALGGVTVENARLCTGAGAAGIAGIRLFQQNDIARIVGELRG